jgi:DNA-binding beta-propeller fold protein YncE
MTTASGEGAMTFRIMLAAAVALTFGMTAAASAADIAAPANSRPESLTVAPDGDVIMGSSSAPKIYRARKGASSAEAWIDLSIDVANGGVLGVLANGPAKTLWACMIDKTPPGPGGKSRLRSFDLDSGEPKSSWALPGDANLCNDMTIGPDGAIYVTDTFNGRIFKAAPDGRSGVLLIEDRALSGVDGVTFMGGKLYVNTVFSGNLYRLDIDAAGKAALTEIWMDRLLRNPDGMRAWGGRLYVAESAAGRISSIAVEGDRASVVSVMTGYKNPTGVQPDGRALWLVERGADKAASIPLPK